MHDEFLLTVFRLLDLSVNKAIVFIPKKKLLRLSSLIPNNYNVAFIFYSEFHPISIKGPISLFKNRIKYAAFLILNLLGYSTFESNENIYFNPDTDYQLLALEFYSPISNRIIKSMEKKNKVTKRSLVLHNIHGYYQSTLSLKIIDKIDLLFNKIIFDEYIVLSKSLVPQTRIKYNKKVNVIPYSIPTEMIISLRLQQLENLFNETKIKFIVPGSVDTSRRDYSSIINAFKLLPNSKYELIFLGEVIDREIIVNAIKENINIVFFEKYVNHEIFENMILNSHFMIYCPSYVSGYGVKKVSGIPFDSSKYCIPMINLSLNESFNELLLEINTKNLSETIQELLNLDNKDYKNIYGLTSISIARNLITKIDQVL
jgi:hypothetical protein